MSNSRFTDPVSRRQALQHLGFGAAAVAAVGTISLLPGVHDEEAYAASVGVTDVDILNFALNLEYLEAEFYAFATTGQGINPANFSGTGKKGDTTGGVQTTFTDGTLQAVATEIAHDELEHVRLLRKALGSKAVAKPALKLDVLGSFATENAFLTYSRAFEDTGVSAYGGAANLIQNKSYLETAARILATEALHSSNVRLQLVQRGVTVPALDSRDVPPVSGSFFAVNSMALSVIRSTAMVLKIVKPFFPEGLNGRIK